MQAIGVASFKTHLSHVLKLVKRGSAVVITSHRHPVGKLVPYTEDQGLDILPPTLSSRALQKIKGIKPLHRVDVIRLLRADRDKR